MLIGLFQLMNNGKAAFLRFWSRLEYYLLPRKRAPVIARGRSAVRLTFHQSISSNPIDQYLLRNPNGVREVCLATF
jgi:hypothetical protein